MQDIPIYLSMHFLFGRLYLNKLCVDCLFYDNDSQHLNVSRDATAREIMGTPSALANGQAPE